MSGASVPGVDVLHALTIGDVLRDHARSRPQQVALVCGDRRLTYPEFDERVSRLAQALAARGLGVGDRILWLGQNCHRVLECLGAAAKLGAVFVPVNWRQSPDELGYVLGHARPAAVVWQEEELGDTVRGARGRSADRAWWIAHDAADGYEQVLTDAPADDPDTLVDPSSSVLMMYTAAFGGRPRGALLSHAGLLHQALAVALVQRVTPDYTYLNSGPLFHIATFMTTMATLHLGGKNVFTRRADAGEILRLVEEERCNGAFLLPPTVEEMGALNADGSYDLSSLVTMKMGVPGFDDAISPESSAWIRAPGGYGQTEVTGLATFSADGGHGTASGRPSPVALVRVVDEDGNEVPPGRTGEIVVRGPVVMNGYLDDPEETARRQRDGWHHTDDLGRREEDGAITFVGPRTALIKTGAENVYPAEVEGCLAEHPAVREVAVIGVPDPTWGQNIRAVVVLQRGHEVTTEDLIEHCRARIASYKKPKDVVFVDRLPRTSAGAVDRAALDAAHGGGGYPGGG